ncbi:hypothetical protein CORC01_01553 [Colletotrichum orchidophilum]|uniref:Uncharacterized protein n=1 Tax=Colletotrichum orchidophilum TaxID=1209926 RepID=A0A1G4BNZ1_9PEZI|nr:uncharacterized protein CORC01_01553 [Colletotrichum orchidophilum]OHF03169.1 hypothetical protein CORC01_01553 [Colletotrichum orchidophilum]
MALNLPQQPHLLLTLSPKAAVPAQIVPSSQHSHLNRLNRLIQRDKPTGGKTKGTRNQEDAAHIPMIAVTRDDTTATATTCYNRHVDGGPHLALELEATWNVPDERFELALREPEVGEITPNG